MEGSPPPFVSRLWRTSNRPSGVSWWGERPTWARHLVYWAIALGLIAATALDRDTRAVPARSTDDLAALAWVVILCAVPAIMGLVFTLKEWEEIGVARNISRSLVLFTFLLGFLAIVLFYARRWGIHIEPCRTVSEMETCQGQASARQVLGLLSWHAANVVPVLDITHSLEWPRPARSDAAVVGASILVIRLWVAIGILGVLKRLWDKWGPGGSRPTVSR